MPENKNPYLCGGVMFFLLKQAVLPNGSPKDHKRGISDDHSEPIVMGDLIYSFTGSKNYGAGKDTSYYKECTSEGSINVPFNDIAIITAYDNTVRERFPDALNRMSEFVATHFNPEMKNWFVRAILEIVENDSDISEDQEFFICEDGSSVSKEALRSITEFKLQPFMVGILHFILKERRNKNCLGAATLDTLGDKKNRKARVYTGKMGKRITRSITVSLYEKATVVEPDTQECDLSEMSDDEVIFENLKKPLEMFASVLEAQKHQMAEQIRANKKTGPSEDEPETIEAEVVDDEKPSGADSDAKSVIIQSQTNIGTQTVNNFDIKDSEVTFNL